MAEERIATSLRKPRRHAFLNTLAIGGMALVASGLSMRTGLAQEFAGPARPMEIWIKGQRVDERTNQSSANKRARSPARETAAEFMAQAQRRAQHGDFSAARQFALRAERLAIQWRPEELSPATFLANLAAKQTLEPNRSRESPPESPALRQALSPADAFRMQHFPAGRLGTWQSFEGEAEISSEGATPTSERRPAKDIPFAERPTERTVPKSRESGESSPKSLMLPQPGAVVSAPHSTFPTPTAPAVSSSIPGAIATQLLASLTILAATAILLVGCYFVLHCLGLGPRLMFHFELLQSDHQPPEPVVAAPLAVPESPPLSEGILPQFQVPKLSHSYSDRQRLEDAAIRQREAALLKQIFQQNLQLHQQLALGGCMPS
jgi:hypothetical protein